MDRKLYVDMGIRRLITLLHRQYFNFCPYL
jgi:hypothetical protein